MYYIAYGKHSDHPHAPQWNGCMIQIIHIPIIGRSNCDEYHMDEGKYCRQTLVSADAVTAAGDEAEATSIVDEGDEGDADDDDSDIYRNNKCKTIISD